MSQSKKILLVDDDKNLLKSLESFLKDKPYKLFPAVSGKEALRLLEDKCPDIAVLDLQMPDVNGVQILRAIKEKGYSIKTIVVTSFRDDYEKSLNELKPDAVFEKPFGLEEIINKIEELLQIELPAEGEAKKEETCFRKLKLLFIEGSEGVFKAKVLPPFLENPYWKNKIDIRTVTDNFKDEIRSSIGSFKPDIVLFNTTTCEGHAQIIETVKKSTPHPKDFILYQVDISDADPSINEAYSERLESQVERVGVEWGILPKTERTKDIELKKPLTVEERVKEILYEQLEVAPEIIKPKSRLIEDFGMDSLDAQEIVMALEEEFDIEILDKEIDEIITVEGIVKYIEKRLKKEEKK